MAAIGASATAFARQKATTLPFDNNITRRDSRYAVTITTRSLRQEANEQQLAEHELFMSRHRASIYR